MVTMAQPSYSSFLSESLDYMQIEFTQLVHDLQHWPSYRQRLAHDFSLLAQQITLFDVSIVLSFAILLTLARHWATSNIFLRMAEWRGIPKDEREKIPESAWKLSFYLISWSSVTYYLFVHNQHDYFANPTRVWQDYSVNNAIEPLVYWIYVMEFSFYLHSLYTTLLIDQRRKDTYTLMFHHILCELLMIISYGNKSHKSGLLTLFLHDGCDVLLEATKLTRYFKVQNGVVYDKTEIFVNIGFASFLAAWMSNRLYWFPLKQIYVASVYTKQAGLQVPFIFPLVLMLWAILIMNFYWFSFAIRLLFRVASGQIKELEDNREFQENGKIDEEKHNVERIKLACDGHESEGKVRKMSIDSGVELGQNIGEEDSHSTESVEESQNNTLHSLRQRRIETIQERA